MDKKDLTIKEYIDSVYYNFKDCGKYDDLNTDELTSFLILNTKNILNECHYQHIKNKKNERNEDLKKIFKNICILAKINNINLVD